jgi:hypothetical protein
MSDAELRDIEAGIDPAVLPFRVRADLRALVAEVRRLRAICAATLPVMETAIRAGLDNFSTAEEDEIIAGHATVKALRSALAPPAAES